MREESRDAEVILDVVFDRGLLFLVVENLGDRPARSGSSSTGPFSGVGGAKKMQRLTLFGGSRILLPRQQKAIKGDKNRGASSSR